MPVMIGVDPHKASHTAAVLDEHGQVVDQQRIPATLDGYQQLRRWAGRWPQRCWAVEGAHGIGRALAQRLVGDGERVLDVPAKLAARVRVLSVGHGRKSDPHDAVSVAVAARNAVGLRQVGVEDQAVVLHLLIKRRQDLVAARTQTINRLHRLLMDLVPGGARRNLTAKRAAALLAAVTPAGVPAATRHQLAGELVGDIRDLEQRIAGVEARIKTAVAESKTTLVQLFGVGPVLAATFLGEVGDVGRFPTKHHFAAHTGTAPLEASSGQVVRHRLSRAGDRKLNHALYMMAMVQVRRPSAGQAYYRRKLAEGKSPKRSAAVLETSAVGCRLPVPAGRSAPPAVSGWPPAGVTRRCGCGGWFSRCDPEAQDGLVGFGSRPGGRAVGSAGSENPIGETQVRIPRLLRAVLTVPVLIGGLLVLTAGPAAACTYPVAPPEATSAAGADAIFVGTLVSQVNQRDPAAEATRDELARELQRRPYRRQRVEELFRKVAQSSDRAVLTFEVRRVYKGRVSRRQEVVTSRPPSCPPLVSGPGPFLIFANSPSPAISSRYQLGPGQYTLALGSRALARGGDPDLSRPGWLAPDSVVVGVAVLAAGIAAGLALATLRARRRPSAD